ncbi:MAG: non-homologous end-joining DNA ligase [Actinobacteria bacterium]|nr:non-homologous end-joining DNA ligase [Actinomycetota bacterium]
MTVRTVAGRDVRLTSLDRVLFPEVGVTKGELLAYVDDHAELLLRDLRGRPVALKRFPSGLSGEGFFQKSRPEHAPDWLGAVDVPLRQGGVKTHAVVEDVADLLFLTNHGTIELHPWLSTAAALEEPDTVLFDLDPPEGSDVAEVRWATRAVRGLLEGELGIATRCKTSGSKGFHVSFPLTGPRTFEETGAFAGGVAAVLAARHPDRLTTETRTAARDGRVLIDVGRNAYGQTAVAPYSVRARPTAPVATPIAWDELSRVEPRRYTVTNLRRRLGQRDDPWRGDGVSAVDLADLAAPLEGLRREAGV